MKFYVQLLGTRRQNVLGQVLMFPDDYRDREFYTNWPNWSDNQNSSELYSILWLNQFNCGAPVARDWPMEKIDKVELVKQQAAGPAFVKRLSSL